MEIKNILDKKLSSLDLQEALETLLGFDYDIKSKTITEMGDSLDFELTEEILKIDTLRKLISFIEKLGEKRGFWRGVYSIKSQFRKLLLDDEA